MKSQVVKRRRRQQEIEEPTSVLDLGSCISPPQNLFNQIRPKKQKGAFFSDEEAEQELVDQELWPVDLLEGGSLKSSVPANASGGSAPGGDSHQMMVDFSIWQPEILLSTSDDEFEMRLLEAGAPGGQNLAIHGDEASWQNHQLSLASGAAPSSNSASSSPAEESHEKLLEMMCSANELFNPMQREDVLQHKIELRESISSLDNFWGSSTFPEAHDHQIQSSHGLHQQIPAAEDSSEPDQAPVNTPQDSSSSDANVGIRLVQLLLACAEAVACRDVNQAAALLSQLQQLASPQGDSMQRVTSCFVEGLTARLAGLQSLTLSGIAYKPAVAPPAARRTQLPDSLRDEGFRLVYEFCPYFSFGHFAANAAILEAFEGESRVHIVDLGMCNALQWPALLQGLASRPGGAPDLVRITGVGSDSSDKLASAGEELRQLAETLNLEFEFRAVSQPVESLQKSMLDVREGEAMAINSAFQLHCVVKESRRSLKSVLQSIHELSPKILALVEQDACHNGPFFLGRFMEALHYYSAIFDAVDSILPCDSQERLKIEQYHFAEEIKNIVACEGPDRVERHERADQWRRRMSRAGFQPKPLKFLGEVKTWLNMYYPSEGYTLVEEKGCIVLGWKGKPIVAASTWRC